MSRRTWFIAVWIAIGLAAIFAYWTATVTP